MAVSVGTITQNPNPSTVNTSITFSHDATGADILIVGGGERNSISSATYAGASVTLLTGTTNGATAALLGYKASPATGSNNVIINFSASGRNSGFAANFSGANGTVGTVVNTTGTSVAITGGNVTSGVGTIIIDFTTHAQGVANFTVGSGQTQAFQLALGNTVMVSTQPGSASTLHNDWTGGSTSNAWAQSAVAVNPASAATTTPRQRHTLLTLGVG